MYMLYTLNLHTISSVKGQKRFYCAISRGTDLYVRSAHRLQYCCFQLGIYYNHTSWLQCNEVSNAPKTRPTNRQDQILSGERLYELLPEILLDPESDFWLALKLREQIMMIPRTRESGPEALRGASKLIHSLKSCDAANYCFPLSSCSTCHRLSTIIDQGLVYWKTISGRKHRALVVVSRYFVICKVNACHSCPLCSL